MAEYYIRREGDDDASGPFDLEQLASLAEAGKLDDTAFYYDMDTEEWRPITDSAEAMEAIHPKKEKLSLQAQKEEKEPEEEAPAEKPAKKKAEPASEETASEAATEDESESTGEKLKEEEEPAEEKETKKKTSPKLKKQKEEEKKPKAIVVEEMLAQAEGREGADPNAKSPLEKRASAAYFGLITATALLLLSAVCMILVEFELVKTANAPLMLRSPYVIAGLVDFVLAVFLILQVTEIYPLIRFKAALGFGFISLLFIASGDTMMALGNALVCIAIYFATATAKIILSVITLLIGLAGIALYVMELLPTITG